MPVNPGLGKGYVSPAVPLATFDEWSKTKPAYAHIPPAPRYANNDWIANFASILQVQGLGFRVLGQQRLDR
jgi:hypothetical protein